MKYIVTHPGKAHFDEVTACAMLLVRFGALRIERREPTTAELDDPTVLVVDIGGMLDPAMGNFDHHQDRALPAAYVLVARYLGLAEQAQKVIPWWDYKSNLDTSGPVAAAAKAGVTGDTMCMVSGLEGYVLSMVAERDVVVPGTIPHILLTGYGESLIEMIRTRWDSAMEYAIWMNKVHGLPAVMLDQVVDPATMEIAVDYVYAEGMIGATVTRASRDGVSWSLYRRNDDPRFDMRRIAGRPGVHFVHANGFLAQVDGSLTAAEVRRLLADCYDRTQDQD